jgi:hypothetical protein
MRKTIVVLCIMLFLFSGCALSRKEVKEDSVQSKSGSLNQTYYGFPDIPVPKELEFVRNRSFVYETASLRAGVMVLSGNVDLQSLENYFKVNMIKNGWRFVNSFKFADISLNFVKDDKTCNIKMSKPGFYAEVEIWVGPAATEKGPMQKVVEPKHMGKEHMGKD